MLHACNNLCTEDILNHASKYFYASKYFALYPVRIAALPPHPFCGFSAKYRLTKKKARAILGILWISAGALALPWLFVIELSHGDEGRPAADADDLCIENWPRGMDGNAYFILVDLLLFYLLPLGTIGLGYFFICLSIWNGRRQLASSLTLPTVELRRQRTNLGTLRKLTLVVASFTLSWLPFYSLLLRLRFGSSSVITGSAEESSLDLALAMAQLLGASNYCLNPILYTFLNARFRRALRALFQGHECKKQPMTAGYGRVNVPTNRGHIEIQILACNIPSSDFDVTPKGVNIFKWGTNAGVSDDNVWKCTLVWFLVSFIIPLVYVGSLVARRKL